VAVWQEVEQRPSFDVFVHKAGDHPRAPRRDGPPRIPGTEVNVRDGELWLGWPGP